MTQEQKDYELRELATQKSNLEQEILGLHTTIKSRSGEIKLIDEKIRNVESQPVDEPVKEEPAVVEVPKEEVPEEEEAIVEVPVVEGPSPEEAP